MCFAFCLFLSSIAAAPGCLAGANNEFDTTELNMRIADQVKKLVHYENIIKSKDSEISSLEGKV